jgi:hypothetical protein
MRIHLRAESVNVAHTVFTVFVDGQNSGRLTMSPDQARCFYKAVEDGRNVINEEFEGSGNWWLEPK